MRQPGFGVPAVMAIAAFFAAQSPLIAQQYVGTVLYPLSGTGEPSYVAADQAVGFLNLGNGATHDQAILWTASGVVNLNPTNLPGIQYSEASSAAGNQQVGWANLNNGGLQALLWTGTAASAVNLSPSGDTDSQALATNGTQQVGQVNDEATLWTGTAASAVNLNPTDFGGTGFSQAYGTDGAQQVGYSTFSSFDGFHATLWSGSAASAVDLNPTDLSGVAASFAYGVGGDQEVGLYENTAGTIQHAVLWYGAADTAVDLNPSGYMSSIAHATNGINQVGDGDFDFESYALVWSGTAASAENLDAFLPSGDQWSESNAFSIDSEGNIYGWASGDVNNVSGLFAVEWSPVPEPAAYSLLLVVGTGTLFRRRPRTHRPHCPDTDVRLCDRAPTRWLQPA
jgi:hypothetical protein